MTLYPSRGLLRHQSVHPVLRGRQRGRGPPPGL